MRIALDQEDDDEDGNALVELRVELPHHCACSSETVWAEHAHGDHYVVRSVPQHAYGLHHRDLVWATRTDPAKPLQIHSVAQPGGHTTLRVSFCRQTRPRDRFPLLDELRVHGVSYEGAADRQIAIDVPPDADYESVLWQLELWQADGRLRYETCEARVAGSFDDAQDDTAAAAIQTMVFAVASHHGTQTPRTRA